jgi:hypothetical protein
MGDLLGSLIWGAKSGPYCVIGGGSLQTCRVSMLAYIASTCNVLSFNIMHIEFRCSTC